MNEKVYKSVEVLKGVDPMVALTHMLYQVLDFGIEGLQLNPSQLRDALDFCQEREYENRS